jgi:gliding-associated putative ABC transporter substrate-binding component GldG
LVGYNEARKQPDPREYSGGIKLAAALFEGTFTSLFQNRILPGDPRSSTFVSSGKSGKVLICADGDVIVNDYDYKRNTPLPLGFDRVLNKTFGNKDFVMHALDYMTDSNGLITSRNKEVAIRGLDKVKVQENRKFWQGLNLLLPLALIALLGALRYYIRLRKYG